MRKIIIVIIIKKLFPFRKFFFLRIRKDVWNSIRNFFDIFYFMHGFGMFAR